jgi:hypothetical protein
VESDLFIQVKNIYNNEILKQDKLNMLSLKLINNRPFNIDTNYYTRMLKKYINNSMIIL